MSSQPIPTTVITGALGAGKTTVILGLIKQLPPDYKVMWLKNEYGDVSIDSELSKASNIQTQEILNGCICCVLLGKLHDALAEIVEEYSPDRLIIETAGTAYPFPIVDQISQIEGLKLDGLITVVDALNFKRFADKSPLAKQQAKYVDLVVINKVSSVDEAQLDLVMDEVYDLYLNCPKVKTATGQVDVNLLLGIDPLLSGSTEVEIGDSHSHPDDVEVFSLEFPGDKPIVQSELTAMLESLPSSDFYRIKGIINTTDGVKLLNYVLGKVDWSELRNYHGTSKMVVMGKGILEREAKFNRDLFNTFIK